MKEEKPDQYISKLISAADGCGFLNYYQELQNQFNNPKSCMNHLKEEFTHNTKEVIQNAEINENSKLGAYLAVNPRLEKPRYNDKLEFQRVIITRYRCGAHNLLIEKGRRPPQIPQEERLCKCNTYVQTLKHVIMDCPLLRGLREEHAMLDIESGVMNDLFLLEMEKTLEVK